jgi:hypothetical protein
MHTAVRTCLKFCVPCTLEFLISATPHLQSTTSGYPSVALEVKHRQLVHQVGVIIDDPLANSMAIIINWVSRSNIAHEPICFFDFLISD